MNMNQFHFNKNILFLVLFLALAFGISLLFSFTSKIESQANLILAQDIIEELPEDAPEEIRKAIEPPVLLDCEPISYGAHLAGVRAFQDEFMPLLEELKITAKETFLHAKEVLDYAKECDSRYCRGVCECPEMFCVEARAEGPVWVYCACVYEYDDEGNRIGYNCQTTGGERPFSVENAVYCKVEEGREPKETAKSATLIAPAGSCPYPGGRIQMQGSSPRVGMPMCCRECCLKGTYEHKHTVVVGDIHVYSYHLRCTKPKPCGYLRQICVGHPCPPGDNSKIRQSYENTEQSVRELYGKLQAIFLLEETSNRLIGRKEILKQSFARWYEERAVASLLSCFRAKEEGKTKKCPFEGNNFYHCPHL